MSDALQIGNILEVRGTRVKVQVKREMNHSSFIYKGTVITNITVNGFIIIKKGWIDIVGKIDAEYIDDLLNKKKYNEIDYRYNKNTISRILEVQIIGFFENVSFFSGVKHLPMIGNVAYIPTNQQINDIYRGSRANINDASGLNKDKFISLGESMYESINVELSINSFFTSHIGIFGNTGSGKSNTLSKLYFEIFRKIDVDRIKGKSAFHVIDFNGEYAHKNVFGISDENLKIININKSEDASEKIDIAKKYFNEPELLSILFNATEQTQKPFIKRLLKRMNYASEQNWTIKNWLPNLYAKSLVHSNKEVFEYIKEIIEYLLSDTEYQNHEELQAKMLAIEWHSIQSKFRTKVERNFKYFDSVECVKNTYSANSGFIEIQGLCDILISQNENWFKKFIIDSKLQLVSDMLNKYAQFEHINPLIHRVESKILDLSRIINVTEEELETPLVTIYSLRDCQSDVKKILPPLIAKMLLDKHKRNTRQENIDKTIHLIIDEAHNTLSYQPNAELKEWQDYRLEIFEEIIKEGRKFGFFLTISSQRPADISSTIISQIHNYFIHRLVNNKDLEMIDNTIPTLDRVSKSAIPSLSSGCCIVTGSSLSMPIFLQVARVQIKEARPNSDNVNLIELWN